MLRAAVRWAWAAMILALGAASGLAARPVVQQAVRQAALPALASDEADAVMARAASRVFSSQRAGLVGFDCRVHPDWRWIFMAANPGAQVAGDDPRLALLEPVRIELHVDLNNGATLEWRPPASAAPRDRQSEPMLERMHQASEQTLTGFFQFWVPFVDGSAVPGSARGLTLRRLEKGFEAEGEEQGTRMRERFGPELTLEAFEVTVAGRTVATEPAYTTGADGLLLVSGFDARIGPAPEKPAADNAASDNAAEQRIHATVDYKTVEGLPIPARVTMEAAGQGSFAATLDECRVSRKSE